MSIAGIWASFLGLPRWIHAALAGALAFGLWLHFHDRAVIGKHEAAVTGAVASQSASAGQAAGRAIDQSRNEVEQGNDQARDAAARNPDDPLRAGLGQLRRAQGAAKPASR